MVVNVLPLRDDLPGLTEAPEQLTRQAFISEPAMEAFHESVLPWAARFDVARADVDHIQERPQRLADELRAVVASNVLGTPWMTNRSRIRNATSSPRKRR